MFVNLFKFIMGFAVGAVGAAAIVSLTTPESGEKVREDIRNEIDVIKSDYESGRQQKIDELEAEIRKRCGEQ